LNLDATVLGMIDLLRRTLGETIELDVVGDAGLWQCVADPGQMENALLNLAINARDGMPTGGKLTIETANARLDDEYAAAQEEVTAGQYVLLAVSDTGVGMAPEVVEKAFEPFFTTKEAGRGSGLGLSMVYGFVKQSNGHIKIYSEPDEGTTVKMYMPRMRGTDRPEAEQPQTGEPRGRGEVVLVVEDDPDVRTLAVTLLRGIGYDALDAPDGASALSLLAGASGVALLLTDVVLPGGMSGSELAREAARLAPGLKVLYMSGYTENAIVHQSRLDEGVKLLQKPFRKADLARRVRDALDQK
jgi:CheY-like chemotaxis protein